MDSGSTVERAVDRSSDLRGVRRRDGWTLGILFAALALATLLYELAKDLLFPGTNLWESHAMTILFVSAIATFAAHRVILRQRSQRAALQEAEARYRALVEEASDLIWQIDRDGVFTFVSPRVRSMLGYDPGGLVGRTRYALMQPRDAERIRAFMANPARLPAFEAELQRRDGSWVEVETSVTPVFKEAVLLGCRGIDRDVSARKQVEREREEAARRKNEVLAMISHELRNPLTPIQNSLFVLQRAAPGGDQASAARAVIERQVRQLAQLVDDLLDTTRVGRGKLRLQQERLDLADVVRRAVEDHRTVVQGHQLTVELPQTSIWMTGDPTRLSQVVGNLLNNAAKFTPEGGSISVALAERTGCAVLVVADTGMGIDAGALQTVFEPFAQAQRSLDRSRGGLGLGLALVKGLVELHGGEVGACSEGPGRGARFTVRLPLGEPGAAAPGAS